MNRAGPLAIAIAAAAVGVFALRGGGGVAVPTESQARTALDAKYEKARTGDPKMFCGDTDIPQMCESQWNRLGGKEGVPRDPPRVVSAREQDGYRVLRVCGEDGRGQKYRTDFVVGMEDGEITYALPVFWNGATFSGDQGDEAPAEVDPAEASTTRVPCP